jgi:hypothetical protein
MEESQENQQRIPESLADEPTRQKLAIARKRTHVRFARKLKVNEETARRHEKRADLYLSTLREYIERKGGNLWLRVQFPDQPPVILAGLGTDAGKKQPTKKAGNGAKSKPKTRRAA